MLNTILRFFSDGDSPSKFCSRCEEEQLLSEFHRDRGSSDGRGGIRRGCHREYRNRPVNRRRSRSRHFRRMFGLTLEQVEGMLLRQKARCFLCEKQVVLRGSRKSNSAHVDHDGPHGEECGPERVRAILCSPCNKNLGWAEKDGAEKVARYVGSRPHRDFLRRGTALTETAASRRPVRGLGDRLLSLSSGLSTADFA